MCLSARSKTSLTFGHATLRGSLTPLNTKHARAGNLYRKERPKGLKRDPASPVCRPAG
jgi:hypothetical protein